MTDAELSRAVADACGIEVTECYGRLLLDGRQEPFIPAYDYNDAFYAAEKCGLFDEMKHRGCLKQHEGSWWIEFAAGEHFRDARRNASGPRAICEAILAVTKK